MTGRPLRAAAAALGLALSVAACASLRGLLAGAFEKPHLEFRTLRVAELSLTGAMLETVWSLENPNAVGLTLGTLEYAFFVEGRQVTAGRPAGGLEIPASRTTELVFPAEVRFRDVVPAVTALLAKDTARYRAEGRVGVDTPVGRVELPLAKEGTFALPELPGLAIGAPRLRALSLGSARLEVPLTVRNPNAFPLPLAGLEVDVSIGGARVGSVAADGPGLLAPGGEEVVRLPVQVDFASAARAATALRDGRGTVSLAGRLRSGPDSVPFSVEELTDFVR